MNVPKLRFKEFNDEWKKIKYKDVLKIKSGKDQKEIECENGIYPILGTGGQIGTTNIYLYNKPSVLIGRKGTINKPQYMESPFWTVDTLFYSEIFINNLPKFIFYTFQNVNWKKYDESTGVPSLSCNTIENVESYIPEIKEQNKISNFLSLLDKKIELQSKKIEALKLYKMCISKNFFDNKNLKTTLLKNICNIKKGQQLNNEYLKVNGIYYMLNGGMLPSGYTDNYNTLENTISISEGGNSCGYVNFNKEKFWSGGHCYTVEPININNEYLFQLLKYYEKAIMSLRVGSGLPNIQKKDLELFKVAIHTQDEQKNISKTLCKIDLKIDLENKKLFKLESLKKGLMQNMFV